MPAWYVAEERIDTPSSALTTERVAEAGVAGAVVLLTMMTMICVYADQSD